MKINVKEAKVTSNVPKENVTAMSISVDGMEHIMELLTNLYKDPELAVIREYYTNALDAHKEAGVTAPVKITLPTWHDPSYRVQDFGVGMSKDDITNIYAQYGASTKRDTNDQLGAFGLGCKSALTITQQFTLVSIKDGIKTTVLISKSESGINTVNVISSVETSEGNGTTVQIPVKSRLYDFLDKAEQFFAFSEKGAVLVDGSEPSNALEEAQKVEDPKKPDFDVYLKPKADGESYVIMGPVPYALSQVEVEASLKRINATTTRGFVRMPKYFRVPIGSVDLTPSREGLRFTDRTNEVIDAHMSFVVNDLKAIGVEELDGAKNYKEFMEIYHRWNGIVNIERKLKGEEVPTEVMLDKEVRVIDRSTWGGSSHASQKYIDLKTSKKHRLVTGFSAEQYKKVNGYLTPYLNSLNLDNGLFLVTDDPKAFNNKWIDFNEHFVTVDGNEIIEKGREFRKQERIAAAKANGSAKKSVIRYPVYDVDESKVQWVEHTEIAEDTPYLRSTDLSGAASDAITGTYRNMNHDRWLSTEVSEYFETVTDAKEIIFLNGSRTVKALEQRVKKTYSLVPEINKAVSKVQEVMTDDVAKYDALRGSSWQRFLTNSGINKHISKIKDPEIVEILQPNKAVEDDFAKYIFRRKALHYFYNHDMGAVPMLSPYDAKFIEALDKKYPLMGAMHVWTLKDRGTDHMVKYFNMIHEEASV